MTVFQFCKQHRLWAAIGDNGWGFWVYKPVLKFNEKKLKHYWAGGKKNNPKYKFPGVDISFPNIIEEYSLINPLGKYQYISQYKKELNMKIKETTWP